MLTYKDSKKLKEWTVKFWRRAAEMAFLLETDELKHENNAGLFRASEQAHSFFKLQEDDREKKRKRKKFLMSLRNIWIRWKMRWASIHRE